MGRTMTRFMKIACGVSVLALAYAANADQQQVVIKGYAPGFCNITLQNYTVQNVLSYDDGKGNATFDYSPTPSLNFFVNSDGTGAARSATVNYSVASNDQCNYSLSSMNWGLKNGSTGFIRDYYADARPASGSATPVHLVDGISPGGVVNSFSIPSSQGLATNPVVIEFNIPASGVLQAGQYQDILYFTVTPAH